MVKWVDINGRKLRYIESSKINWIVGLDDNGEEISHVSTKTPLTTTLSSSSSYYKFLKQLFVDSLPQGSVPDESYFASTLIPQWTTELIKNKITEEEQQLIVEKQLEEAKKEEIRNLSDGYAQSKAEFDYYLEKYDMTPLEFIVSVARCLCADSVREVVRAFVGFFLTYKGFKATNVIAIGSASAGKSFILETALSMCPDEKVHRGIMSRASFFREFDGMNLDGHIFYLGDLGGINDDQKTIDFRDILKELTTDGYTSDTIAKDNTDTETLVREVFGRPAIWYTTAHEEIVNEQEKSRSIILTPQDVDATSLIIFNAIWQNNGSFYKDIVELGHMREAIKGYVYTFPKMDVDYFNPYMFCIKDAIEDTDDFNRKIQEFDATLEVVSLLSDPASSIHDWYYDEENQHKDTQIIFSSKRDNLNAINLFDAINFLPDEARFGDELLSRYKLFDLSELENDIMFDENDSYEDKVMLLLKSEEYGFQPSSDMINTIQWKDEYAYNVVNGQCNIKYPFFEDNWFTISSLKKRFGRAKWFKRNRGYVSDRLYKLAEEGVLLKIGKDGKENVYCLNEGNGSKISEKLPKFDDEKSIKRARDLFAMIFPDNLDDYDAFVDSDMDKDVDVSNLTESVNAMFPNLPYLSGDLDV